MTKSPCATCKDLPADKNGITCTNCAARQAYVAAMGAPWDMGPVNTEPKKEVKPVTRTAKYAEVYGSTKLEGEVKSMDEPQKTKYCPMCRDDIPVKEFSKDKTRKDGLASLCRTHKNEQLKKHRAKHGRSDTKAGKVNEKIKSIYIDPPVSPTLKDIAADLEDIAADMARVNYGNISPVEKTVGQEYGDDFLSIDMAGHGDVLDRLTEAAIRDLRTPEMQALYILREALCHHPNSATS